MPHLYERGGYVKRKEDLAENVVEINLLMAEWETGKAAMIAESNELFKEKIYQMFKWWK
jgi:hypothetical protein